jgi:NTE family protein
VRTGKAVIFGGQQLTVDAVMASACLPMLFKAVEIDGEHYWDGGYSVNPALAPLIDRCDSPDLMLVQLNPLRREQIPQTSSEILDRVNELTFNASLLTQMRAIDLINRLIATGALQGSYCKTVLMHRIDGGQALHDWPASTKTSTDGTMIRKLFEAGQTSAHHWLEQHFDALGQRSTVDIRQDYLDDTRQDLPPRAGAPGIRERGFRPWLARLFRRSKNA